MVITLVSLLVAAWQAQAGVSGLDLSEMNRFVELAMLGNNELNGMSFALAISAWGGMYTFLVRFAKTRSGLLN